MSSVKAPPEKKRLSLALDRRNNYGENSKASRKNIPKAKARSNRAERRTVQQVVSEVVSGSLPDEVEAQARSTGLKKVREKFKKWPDEPLVDAIQRKKEKRIRLGADA
jgi:hypothetical protein